ncbi:tryptophanase leader peptide [Haemophilus haemolyticus]|uniref:Tryptophanase leader peptide n=1 Tax=Haemophilus haemolyticus TaxID=726 RepID=A0ABY2YQB9_HAEHA|nr:tryptophanase leader peptide [Haemophilus haemolyticus]TPH05947.1 tryptophanase leader peptide [Haemophilus haemolyticus]TPH24068.1 tryptophanase leader peptide [Haemophilus haemolyticus]
MLSFIKYIFSEKEFNMLNLLSPNQTWVLVDPRLSFYFPIIY